MPVYTSRKFSGFALASLVIGIAIVGLVGLGITNLFPIFYIRPGMAFYQVIDSLPAAGKPTAYHWAQLNHTIRILENNVIESIFILTAKETPSYSHNIEVEVNFDNPYHTYTPDDPVGVVLEGNQTWSGVFGQDLQINQTIIIYTKIRFDFDAKYLLKGWIFSRSFNGGYEGYGTIYYITVEQGRIIKVTDQSGETPPSTEMKAVQLPP